VSTDENRDNALHSFCRLRDIGEEMVAIFHELLRCCPDTVRTRDIFGALPLHYAASSNACWNAGITEELVTLYKEGATIADREGKLPVHSLFAYDRCSEERLKILLEANPAGVSAKTVNKQTVMHRAASTIGCSNDNIVEILHKLNPKAVQMKDSYGDLPLHLACKVGIFKNIKAIYDCYPAAIRAFNNRGSVPMDRFFKEVTDECSWDEETHWDTLQLLLRHSPPAVVHKYALQSGPPPPEEEDDVEEGFPAFVRRLLLRADPTAHPNERRALNYAERRMAMFLIFAALSGESAEESFVSRLRSLAFDYGPEMYLVKAIVSFL
jgi:hypothetical protein